MADQSKGEDVYIDPFVAGLTTGTFGWFIVIVLLAVAKAMGKKS